MNKQCSCHQKASARDEKTIKTLDNRINRIIGQLNGIKAMIDDNRYCGDVLIQVAAVESALQSFGYMILKDHMDTCVIEHINDGDNQIMDETLDLIKKLK